EPTGNRSHHETRCGCFLATQAPQAGIRQRSFRPQAVMDLRKIMGVRTNGSQTMNRRAGFHVGLVGLALAGFGGHALAATECNTGPAPNPPLTGTVTGGVVVNAGEFCILGGANVSGGLRVNPGGVLIVCGSTINGGFTANGAAELIFGAEEIDC